MYSEEHKHGTGVKLDFNCRVSKQDTVVTGTGNLGRIITDQVSIRIMMFNMSNDGV